MLNLGLINQELSVPSFNDILVAKCELMDAYQEFVDYKNVCEIVKRSQTSTERIAFANDLLGVSIDSIDISVEKLTTALRTAWEKFVGLVKKAISYIKYNIVKHSFKEDGEFKVELVSRANLRETTAGYEELVKKLDAGEDVTQIYHKLGDLAMRSTMETFTKRADVVEWLRLLDEQTYAMERVVKREGKNGDIATSLLVRILPAVIKARKRNLDVLYGLIKKSDKAKS